MKIHRKISDKYATYFHYCCENGINCLFLVLVFQASSEGNYTFTLEGNLEGEVLVRKSMGTKGNLLSLLVQRNKPRQVI